MGKGRPRRVSWYPALCGCLHRTIEGTVPLSLASDNKNLLYEEDCGQFIQPKLTLALLSLSQILWVVPPPSPLHFFWHQCVLLQCLSKPRTARAAPREHVHCAVSSACLVLAHSPGAPILVLGSLARKCAGVWTLLSLVPHFRAAASSAVSSFEKPLLCSCLFFAALPPAPAHGFAFQEAEAPPTVP